MDATPTPDPGLTLVEQPDVGALHRLVVEREGDGEVLWVDAGGAASTYGLTARVPTRRALRGIRVARAFTAHQHHELVRRLVSVASGRTELVVAPNVAALYDAADASAAEIDRLFAASLVLLADLAEALAVPVLVTAPGASESRRTVVEARATDEIACEATPLGYAYETEDFETPGYWRAGWWQTTVPYWVELCGTVDAWATDRSAADCAAEDPATTGPAARGPATGQAPVDAAPVQRPLATDGGW